MKETEIRKLPLGDESVPLRAMPPTADGGKTLRQMERNADWDEAWDHAWGTL